MNWKRKRDKDDDWSRVFDDMDGMFDAFPNFKKVKIFLMILVHKDHHQEHIQLVLPVRN